MHVIADTAIMVCGEVSRREDDPRIVASEIYPLRDAPNHFTHHVSLHVPTTHLDEAKMARIREVLRLHPGPTPVVICLLYPSGEKVFIDSAKDTWVRVDDDLIHQLHHLLGEEGVFVAVKKEPFVRPRNGNRGRR
jgi:hypothetical protein